MKTIEARGAPNPRRVRIFAAEKRLDVPYEQIDLLAEEHRSDWFQRLNPYGGVPVLVLDDGTPVCETVAICRYLEALEPEPALFGRGALESAQIEMWNRRMEFSVFFPVATVFRHTHPRMAALETPQIPEWAQANRVRAENGLRLLDARLGESDYVAGDAFTIADITAFVAVGFMKVARLERPEGLDQLARWYETVKARPSVEQAGL